MNTEKNTIAHICKIFVFITIICAMVFQPVVQNFISVDNPAIELGMDSKEEPFERESQEEDPKEEKIELQIVSSSYCDFLLTGQDTNFGEKHLMWDVNLETHIPPPEQG